MRINGHYRHRFSRDLRPGATVMLLKFSALIPLLLASSHLSFATDWYAAPNGSSSGDGTRTNPWPLQVALRQNAFISPGDTLYLRGGPYIGPGFVSQLSGTSNNYITIRSCPGEWGVITDRKANVLLAQRIGTTNNSIQVTGSANWQPGLAILV